MSSIVLGIGTSHSPQISTPPDLWHLHAQRDRAMPELVFRGKSFTFAELQDARASEGFESELDEVTFKSKHERCQVATAKLAEELDAAAVDAVIVFGNDHKEFFANSLPALGIYSLPTVDSVPLDPEAVSPSVRQALWARQGEETESYPCDVSLSGHLLREMTARGFDVANIDYQDPERSIGHAFTHIRRRLMKPDHPIPMVPVLLNSSYPPNQPTARRCVEIGRAVAEAVASHSGDLRVAIIGSGGLSHFVVDEDFDRAVIEAMRVGDLDRLAAIGETELQQGTTETRHWFAAAAALSELSLDYCEYVPGYRTEAGTGCGMAFLTWRR
jgi:3-O-methylgallate 3,4-dioxygenase